MAAQQVANEAQKVIKYYHVKKNYYFSIFTQYWCFVIKLLTVLRGHLAFPVLNALKYKSTCFHFLWIQVKFIRVYLFGFLIAIIFCVVRPAVPG